MDSSRFAHRSHALRRGRVSAPGRIYLLTAVTHRRYPVFRDWQAARLLIGEMRTLQSGRRSGPWPGSSCPITCTGWWSSATYPCNV